MAYKLDPSLAKPGGWLTRNGLIRLRTRRRANTRQYDQQYLVLLARLVRERRVSEYVAALSERLRNVQVFWNDFEVVAGNRKDQSPSALSAFFSTRPTRATCGDFDYDTDGADVWHRAARWAVANGDNPKLRIAVCGYNDAESDALFPTNWARFIWSRSGIGQA
jgi:hypothetical protein